MLLHTQAVLQGAFILAKANGGAEIAAASIDDLHRYIELPPPILLRLALHRRRRRVLELRENAFEAKLAGMGEDGRAVALICSLKRMPGPALARIDASVALRT
jgi:hypothetical protein